MLAFEKDAVSEMDRGFRWAGRDGIVTAEPGESFAFWTALSETWTDSDADGRVDPTEITRGNFDTRAGRSRPSRLAGLRTDLTVASRWRLGTHLDYRGGHLVPDAVERTRCNWRVCAAMHEPDAPIAAQIRAWIANDYVVSRRYLLPADAIRVRELSLSFDERTVAHSVGASNLRLTLAIRNAGFLWSRSKVWDPETFAAGRADLQRYEGGLQSPVPRDVVLRASLSY